MAGERVQRRLTAILAADVVGYSRLMEADEEGTRARLRALQSDLIDPRIAADGGRVVKTSGDGMLVEFASAVDAVRNALSVQRAMRDHNANVAEDTRIKFRVGVNLGDVIVEGDDIHGDGVNVAARLEGLCEPGEVFVSGTVRDHVEGKLAAGFDDLGEHTVKNIARPVRVWRAREETAGQASHGGQAVAAADKPSIAVLPFENMSGDAEQEYFADGIAEDIITALSRFRWFFVIARNSSFTYKGKAVDVKQVARELGVQYVLEGSVRKAANRVRITAQLIDAASGRHVWAERYDRELDDIFAVQDEITEVIAGAVAPSFVTAEARRVDRRAPASLDVWDSVMRGNWHLWRQGKDDLAEARRLYENAIERDADCAPAHGGLALACIWQLYYGFTSEPDKARSTAAAAARNAVSLDANDAWAHTAMGLVRIFTHGPDDAAISFRQAIDLNQSLGFAEGLLAVAEAYRGNDEQAIVHADRADHLNPRDPFRFFSYQARAHVALMNGRYGEAVGWCRRTTEVAPDFVGGWRLLAACLAHDGELDEARDAVGQLRQLAPDITLESCRRSIPAARDEHLELYVDGLRKAGLAE